MKKKLTKLTSYYFNIEKKYKKMEMFANWLTIILPISFMTIIMIIAANGPVPPEKMKHSISMSILGLCIIIWVVLLIWMVVYKTFRRFKRTKLHNQTLKKDDWEE